ncbi:MAG: hypothetical protein HOH74_06255, partial [Gemmatimonadetes bacterium]|nr:hypothetical protein [Gemmatimonadota bacterium]
GWCSYDYHASIVSGHTNVFILATHSPDGGPDGSGCVWTDHTRWSADTPEQPLSILPLLFYRSWVDADPIDLRGAEMSVSLRGDGMRLDGARCTFWVHAQGSRWHLTGQPVDIGIDSWASSSVRLKQNPDQWHNSWSMDPQAPAPLERVLAECVSYGFAFTGFSSEVSGRLSMARFHIDAV